MSRAFQMPPSSAGATRGQAARQGCRARTLTGPAGTKPGDQMSPKMRNSDTPEKGAEEGSLKAQLLTGDSIHRTGPV